jgi:formate-dependent nitrite reductase membrane component NrfD
VGEGRRAGELVRGVYNAQHRIPWHWPVPAYLVTKGMGTGVFPVLALGVLGDLFPVGEGLAVVGGLLSLVFLGLTTALLVLDLERPERFLRILTRPQWRSWLTRGGYLLVGFSLLVSLWWGIEAGAWAGLWSPELPVRLRGGFFWAGVPLALASAVYTAFLFGQAEGRDLWQSPLLPFHLVVQAAVAGAATLLLAGAFIELDLGAARVAVWTLSLGLVLDLLVALPGELAMPHASADAARAAHEILKGRYRLHLWVGAVLVGHLAPLALLLLGGPWAAALAGALALAGLYSYEHAFVLAPQEVPNS